MSQENTDKADVAEARTQQTRGFMTVEPCRRECIKPGAYYAWTKDFLEAGKKRLTRDAVRDATRQEIDDLKGENSDFKYLVADLSLNVYRLKKTATPAVSFHVLLLFSHFILRARFHLNNISEFCGPPQFKTRVFQSDYDKMSIW